MCLCWHSYLCWRFILVCVKMIVAPWILKCTSTWLKTFEHASCSLPIAISLCIDCLGFVSRMFIYFRTFLSGIWLLFFFFRCLSVFPCRYWVRWARLLVFIICDPIEIPRTIVCHAKIEKSCFLQWTAKIRSSCAAIVVPFFSINCINKRELITILWCSDDEALRFRFGVVECVLAASFFCSDITFLST